ncbi:MAG: flagellar basal body P-ring formation chaperone FlgA [Acetobacteraceae bacterium]|nr:flagellar basal body P-ring formation chaperone FlgA [Acetobacteraceae bacterium]
MRMISFFAALLTAIPAAGATLRPATTLAGAEVHVSDLFDDPGPAGPRVLGAGPAPGGRIVVQAAQAAAIARQFGVAWRPRSGAEQIVIDRPGRMVPREELLEALRQALRDGGYSDDAQIDLSAFSAPQVPPDTKPEIAVEQIDVEPGSGRFTAGLAIVVPGEPLQRLHLAGRVQALVTAVVATHRLMAGAPIQPSDVRLQRVPSGTGQDESAQNLSQVIGQALRHPLNAGQKIAVAELSAPILVQKGALVQIQLQVPGLAVTAAGTAADSGAMGDHIGVLNPASGAIIEAEITGPDQVRVLPGNALRRPARSGQTQISLR